MAMPEPAFEVPRSYETTIAMRDDAGGLDREFGFLCAPISSIHEDNRGLLEDPSTLLSEVLELGESQPLRVAQLPDAIFTLLTLAGLDEEARRNAGSLLELVSNTQWLAARREADPDAALFAEYLAFADVVPFEHSEPKFHPLAKTAIHSYELAGGLIKYGPHATILGAHGPVAFMAAGGAVAVIDSVGVAIGVAISPITNEIVDKVRAGIKRLFTRTKRAGQNAGQTAPPVDTPI
jgi:hypothetical protein